ncbi:alanine racemase [Celerinatantimonas yamalensis]|uniref:Alanine racemase n=1 Tax=Celerinatantimonas yamalensis TaxID=559956 RepID=A0ABW9G3U7_9GAMM
MITAEAVIDLAALKHNIKVLSMHQPHSKMIAVVKGNAYGHGGSHVAHALSSFVDSFAVARFDEACQLREYGITQPIVLLEGCFDQTETQEAARLGFQPVVQNDQQIHWLEQLDGQYRINLWLKVDTGMHRLGFHLEQVRSRHQHLCKLPVMDQYVGFVSHLSCADESGNIQTDRQLQRFNHVTEGLVGPRSLANSAALLTRPDICFDKARPGIALYGVTPFAGHCGEENGLKAVMTLRSKLIAIRTHQCGEPVGYSGLWHASRETMIGVVAMGYGDGYPRTMPTGTPIQVNGRIVPLVGRVSMDMLTVDLGPDASDHIGDEVILWGPTNPVEPIAERVGTIGYELLIQLTNRVKRSYINGCS